MQKICSLQNFPQGEFPDGHAHSPSTSSKVCSALGGIRGSLLKSSLLFLMAMMLISSANALRLHNHEQDLQISTPSNFDFMVFCPATKEDFKPWVENDTRRYVVEINPNDRAKFKPGKTFIVRAESRMVDGKLSLQYCGRLRTFNQYCNESVYGCTSGPMFDIEARSSIDVIWINNLNP